MAEFVFGWNDLLYSIILLTYIKKLSILRRLESILNVKHQRKMHVPAE